MSLFLLVEPLIGVSTEQRRRSEEESFSQKIAKITKTIPSM
jgi:hypothetical protein